MLITIPGQKKIEIRNVVFDFNGTLATDGKLDDCVKVMMPTIAKNLNIYILSSDTYGTVAAQCSGLGVNFKVLHGDQAGVEKGMYVNTLGPDETISVGNGNNDIEMFRLCALSILVIGNEGCSAKALAVADIVVKNIGDALGLLVNPIRITATLRS